MEKCKLCKKNDATQTGSHIVPAFILKTLFERNKEFVVTISKTNVVKNVGRELSPEKIQEYMGRQLTDKELESNHIPFIQDYIFCPQCEKNLGYLESTYSEAIHQKYNRVNITESEIIKLSNKSFLISLFWYSIIWRMSIAHENPFTLKSKEENKLRDYLFFNLKSSLKSLKNYISEKPNECIYPIAVCLNSNFKNRVTGNTVEINTNYRNPYLMHCNEYIIIMYFKPSQINAIQHWFYGLEYTFTIKDILNFDNSDSFKLGYINDDEWDTIKENVLREIAVTKHKEYVLLFKYVANHYNLNFSLQDIGNFIERILSDKLADRHDEQRIRIILKEEILKLRPRKSQK
ncbi:DUF4238 domain-containing protein [Flavobacterium sp. MFBS3-15]|uniref:DUF4238 domain-containing protein n=1 Tax=Flavobacterium sp. MFBS3-15 TaxID=2989816 RepID=UPI0022362A63|nr:DUF4238 domain-containing protein [Flavobacterium sp. MFBS3-15]MCW4468250.1 DUF4238 domain-containing protein [Flavobacterium sp. MFBS3-15]